jgi:hypothetical protein
MSENLEDILRELHIRVLRARRATQDERKDLLLDNTDDVINALLDNESLNDDELLIIVQRKNLSTEVFRRLSNDKRVQSSYQIKKALLFNPKCPASISLKFLGQLFTFDVMSLMLVPGIPGEIKTTSEEILFRKLALLPLGEKLTLARRTNAERVLSALLDDNSREVIAAVLNNPFLREGAVCAALRKPMVKPHVVEQIAANSKWSCRYDVRYALLRTKHLTMGAALNVIQYLTPNDLRDLSNDPNVSPQVRTYIKNNLSRTSSNRLNKLR